MSLIEEIEKLEDEITNLRNILNEKELILWKLKENHLKLERNQNEITTNEVTRYSRQMIMNQITIEGQLVLKQSKILVVGAGGLGCPALQYLAAAGIGEIHVMDYDEVELTNLHRQILHGECDVGVDKVHSAYQKLKRINSNVVIVPKKIHANSGTLMKDVAQHKYNAVLDCTDNVPSRYLLNDVCVLNQTPLVSGSALQMEGQLTVYNYKGGPCYRCLFPVPPPPHTVTSCGDGGVLGASVIGVLQALEAIKIVLNSPGVLSQRLLLFDGEESVFRNIKLRPKSANCEVCSEAAIIKKPIDYEEFCGSKSHDKIVDVDLLRNEDNVSVKEFIKVFNENKGTVFLDVRPELEFKMCKLPNFINVSFKRIVNGDFEELENEFASKHSENSVYVMCRRGNDSQRSVQILREKFKEKQFRNVIGGLHAYSKQIDSNFPMY